MPARFNLKKPVFTKPKLYTLNSITHKKHMTLKE